MGVVEALDPELSVGDGDDVSDADVLGSGDAELVSEGDAALELWIDLLDDGVLADELAVPDADAEPVADAESVAEELTLALCCTDLR